MRIPEPPTQPTSLDGTKPARPVPRLGTVAVCAAGRVPLLEYDPELASGLSGGELRRARELCLAPAFDHARGPWSFFPAPDHGSMGVLILDGLIVVRVETGARAHLELLGQGDVISPWVRLGSEVNVVSVVSSQVVSPVRMVLLDRGFAVRAATWPEIASAVIHRLINRSRRASLQGAINAIPRMDERLEVTLWSLADRYGHVTRDGIKLHLPLTMAQLAEMVAAQRPSVSVAVARLEAQQRIMRPARGSWLLLGEAPSQLAPLVEQSGLA